MALRNIRLVTFDAFGTLFTFRQPIAKTYALAALKHGLSINFKAIHDAFVGAMKMQSRQSPNFGSQSSVSSEQWWSAVVETTFLEAAPASITRQVTKSLPVMTKELYAFFETSDAYKVFDDVQSTLENLASKKDLKLGVISNCDERVATILENLGLKKYFSIISGSRQVGFEKPDPRIFDTTLQRSQLKDLSALDCLHIGDDETKDYFGARKAGWQSLLLDRRVAATSDSDVNIDPSLQQTQKEKPHVIGSLSDLNKNITF